MTNSENETKKETLFPVGVQKVGGYSAFSFNVGAQGGILPTSSLGDSSIQFGGNGADSELVITSGTTTINASNAAIVTKNYSRISITDTATLTISNPHANGTMLILRSQGDVVLASATSINMKGLGGAAGPAGTAGGGGEGNSLSGQNIGGDSGASPNGAGGASGTGVQSVVGKSIPLSCGAGGGGGDRTGGGGGVANGGAGGGAVFIECNNGLNFTGTVSVAGNDGDTTGSAGEGGGGGGGGGAFICIYRNLLVNSGTVTTTAGSGGTGSGTGVGGGGGGGSSASGSNRSTNTGGTGGAGLSLIVANTFFT